VGAGYDFFSFSKGEATLCAYSRFVTRKGPSTLTQRAGHNSQRRYDSQDVEGPLGVTNREYVANTRIV